MPLRPQHLLLALSLATGCRTVVPRAAPAAPSAVQVTVRSPGVEFTLSTSRADAGEVGRLGSSLLAAIGEVARWGSLRGSVEVRVLEDHAALERVLSRPGHPWLRAWAYADLVLLQSPRTWEATFQPRDLLELLAHELTHVLMYQQLEPDDGPPSWLTGVQPEEPPLWFREGMASVTAGQGQKRLSPLELRGWLDSHPGKNPLDPDPELVRTEKEAVYSAAHRAFERLLERGGDQPVRDVLRGMRAGARFGDAFAAATGQQLAAFERDALRAGFATGAKAPKAIEGAGGP